MTALQALGLADRLLALGDRFEIAAELVKFEHEAKTEGLTIMADKAKEIIGAKS